MWLLPNIVGEATLVSNRVDNVATRTQSGAFTLPEEISAITSSASQRTFNDNYGIKFDASQSNAIYTDNGLILLQSISKQSYIIYK